MELPKSWAVVPYKSTAIKIPVINEHKIKQCDYLTKGKYPVIDQGASFIGGYSDDSDKIVNCELPAIVFGDHTKNVKYVTTIFCAGADGIKIVCSPPYFVSKCLYYFTRFLAQKIPNKGYARHYQHLEKEFVPLPPLAEQNRIVEKIDTLLSSLDKGVEMLKLIQSQLRTYRQAVLKWAFVGKFTGTTPKYEKLSKYIEKPRYGTSKKCSYNDGDTCVIRIPNINHATGSIDYSDVKYANFTDAEKETLTLKENDLLIIRSNGSVSIVGRAVLVKKCDVENLFAGYLIRLRVSTSELLAPYLLHYLGSPNARIYIENTAKSTSGVNNINSNEVLSIPIPVCSTEEQTQIISEIESRLSVCDKLETLVNENIAKADSLRQSILKKAFAGQLVPQDPNDESAEELLKRIKAERQPVVTKAKPTRRKKNG